MKEPFKKISLALVIMAVGFSSQAQDKNFYIFLAFGQSNMEGAAKFEEQDMEVNPRFQVLQSINCPDLDRERGNWYPAVPPLTRCHTGLTPVDYFGRTLVESLPDSIRVGVINVSVGGCKIELFEKNRYKTYVETAPDWMINMINAYDGNPYQHLVELAKKAQEGGVIKGILLHQGESNTGDVEWPKKVKGVYENLLSDLGLVSEEVPLLAGEMVSAEQGGKCASMNAIIATLPVVIPTAHVISSEDCEAIADGLHFSAAGYRKLGSRYGNQMLTILGY
ncbi:sialate O-acetylesterase [Echinicola rosea]|uniref:Sialate O-acetylesterase domain-containing protein n=1 Tax=Echinicola rosea TaxID=1807691 RepID=A0ABQ1UU09_9BACT|nr:sialate O-acetylesterase [Echinicola rosea]GGF25250.1 hypothetical protein GCM10011339_11710 [Echinicola rosea]